jgi:hypothetical protein
MDTSHRDDWPLGYTPPVQDTDPKAEAVLVQGASLDVSYLRRWAPTLGVVDLLERALTEGTSVD